MKIARSSWAPAQHANRRWYWRVVAGMSLLLCFSVFAAAQEPQPAPKPSAEPPSQIQPSAPAKPQPDAQERADRELQRLKWFYDQRAYPSGHIPTDARRRALEDVRRMILESAGPIGQAVAAILFPAPTSWTLVGPQPINTSIGGNFGTPTASGRVTALAVDPNNASVVYVGAADGGVWKSMDAGATWSTNFDQQPSLSIGSIAIAPSNSSTVYVGTGQLNFGGDNFYGVGVIKSTDAGAIWAKVAGTITNVPGIASFTGPFSTGIGGAFIGSLAVNPSNANLVLAGARIFSNLGSGIYCSEDGGANWRLVVTGPAGTSVVYANSTTAYAAIGTPSGAAANGIYRATNADLSCAAQTWTKLTINIAGLDTTKFGRITLAIAPSTTGSLATTTIYAAIADSSTGSNNLLALLKSADGGNTWTQLTATPNFCTAQCWSNLVVAVHPTNADFVVLGGAAFTNNSTTLFRSTNGGLSWTGSGADDFTIGSSSVRPHVDHHAIVFSQLVAGIPKLYVGNDGGVWRTDDPAVSPHVLWVNLNGTLSITQFYQGLSVHPSDQNIAFGGNQDNGTDKFTGTLDWQELNVCGDGAHTLIDPILPSTVYANCQNIDINKSVQNGDVFTFNSIVVGLTRLIVCSSFHRWRTTRVTTAVSISAPAASGRRRTPGPPGQRSPEI